MRLKTKLFLSIGALFFVVLALSFVLEDYMTKKSLVDSVEGLKKKIYQVNEQKRQAIEKYLSDILMEKAAAVNALLSRMYNFEPMRTSFELAQEEYYKNIWLQSATLLSSNKWIDLIQTKYNGQLSSLIAVDPHNLEKVSLIDLQEGIVIAPAPPSDKRHQNYVAIPITMSDFLANMPPIKNLSNVTKFYALFSEESLRQIDTQAIKFQVLNLSINPLEPYMHWLEEKYPKTSIAQFIKDIEKAQLILKQNPSLLKQEYLTQTQSHENGKGLLKDQELKFFVSRLDQIGLIWGLATVVSSGSFGFNPFSLTSPVGLVRQDLHNSHGAVLYKDQVFFDKSFISLQSDQKSFEFQNTLSAILPQDKDDLFFGNTLTVPANDTISQITIGINGGSILKDLSLTTQMMSAFISEGILTCAYGSEGQPLSVKSFTQENIHQMLSSNVGTIAYGGDDYYFIHMKPMQDRDFHFFILRPVSQEFALVNSVSRNTKILISNIAMQMRIGGIVALIIVLIVLSQIAKRVTQPISVLARATHFVKEGKLNEVNIPTLPGYSKNNEVDVLYQSFYDMVEGLKEKERVRGVLNKVVSQEIADEILKDETHLGGQEKDVTVFFADIRNFTSLTEKMTPQEVIDLLNKCMTKASSVIDKHSGVIDKFVGDEVMALFGAPISKPESSLHAVLCALEILEILHEWNRERLAQNLPKVEMGIGIHKGLMVAGNMGAEDRLNYTVLGSNVNLGARLCSLAKPMEILISKEVYQALHVKEAVHVEKVEHVALKGFSKEFEIYKVVSKK